MPGANYIARPSAARTMSGSVWRDRSASAGSPTRSAEQSRVSASSSAAPVTMTTGMSRGQRIARAAPSAARRPSMPGITRSSRIDVGLLGSARAGGRRPRRPPRSLRTPAAAGTAGPGTAPTPHRRSISTRIGGRVRALRGRSASRSACARSIGLTRKASAPSASAFSARSTRADDDDRHVPRALVAPQPHQQIPASSPPSTRSRMIAAGAHCCERASASRSV